MANLEFFLEVETTRVQIQVLFRAMADETFDMFPTSITISLGSFAVEFWKGWLLVEFENEVFEDLVVVASLLNMQSLWTLQLQSSHLYLIPLLPYSLHPLHMYRYRFGLFSSLSSSFLGQEENRCNNIRVIATVDAMRYIYIYCCNKKFTVSNIYIGYYFINIIANNLPKISWIKLLQ